MPRGAEPGTISDGGAAATPDDDSKASGGGSKNRGRSSARQQKKPSKTPEPLMPEELQSLGSLMADAAALGQSVEDYVGDLRAQLVAHDRLLEVTGAA